MLMQRIHVERLVSPPYNPRVDLQPGDAEYEKLKRSILEFGYVDPIIWNVRTGNVVGGNQRLKVLKDLGEIEVDCVVIDLDDSHERALNVALNKISGAWDNELLETLLRGLQTDGFDLSFTGFDPEEINALFGPAEGEEDAFDVDAALSDGIPPTVQTGEVWLLGKHRLLCGDSLDAGNVERLMAGKVAGMVFTDPPYNVDYGSTKNPRYRHRTIENDSMAVDDWQDFITRMTDRITENCAGDIYVWGASGPNGMRQQLALVDGGVHWSATIIWKKQKLVLTMAKYQRMYEPCFYGWLESGKSSFVANRKQTEVWEIDRPQRSKLHPTMKPIDLCAHGISNSSLEGDIVLDLFGGSGSTLIAAEQIKRVCYMAELDPKYCDVIIRRWQEATGKAAKRESDGAVWKAREA